MSAIGTNAESADTPTHQPNPERMRKFVPKDVNQDWARQPKKSYQPEQGA
jgi:hypothetical protein